MYKQLLFDPYFSFIYLLIFLHPTVPPRTTHKMIMIVDSKGGKET